ncbi:TPA: type II toxin-antitoxin system VapC family toxin [archaeon]|nr:type II toxin-antitoxin system VapC family toxin [Candidatus Naiadarchaeales archaeon SRR2090153.bin461]
MKAYLDANIFIYPILYSSDSKEKKCKQILNDVVSGRLQAITSSLTLDEIIWKIIKKTGRQKTLKLAKDLFELPNLTIVEVGTQDMFNAIELMEKYPHLKPRDAIHAAVAINNNAAKIYSDDPDFDGVKEIGRVGLD